MSGELPPGVVPAPRLAVAGRASVVGSGLTTETGGGGLVLGTDDAGAPVAVTLFRAEPTSAVCLGGLPLAQRLVLRALALGARVVVETSRPSAWAAFGQLAAGPTGPVTVLPPHGVSPSPDELPTAASPSPSPGEHPGDELAGNPEAPRLLVVDHDAAAAGEPRRLGRWSALLTCVDGVNEWSQAALAGADLIVSRPLTPAETRLLSRALNVDEGQLQVATDPGQLLLAARAGACAVRHTPTSVEQWLTAAGAPRG